MQSPLIVALDVEHASEAIALAQLLGADARAYKVGLQLLVSNGPAVVRELVAMGKDVFLDLKLHEIPNSVAAAVTAAGKLGASMVTVHASAGAVVMKAAVEAASAYPRLKVLAVTVITSMADSDLVEIGLAPSVQQQVAHLANLAARAGCDGVVASAHEAAYLTKFLPQGSLIVTPGIHFADAFANDQTRVATPAQAAAAGATHIVIGRAVTRAHNPVAAFERARLEFTNREI